MARRAVEAARDGPGWAATPAQRRTLLNRAMGRAPDVAGVMTEGRGHFGWGMFNCDLAARMLREAAAQAYSSASVPSDVRAPSRWVSASPGGRMAPWNAPVILSARAIATPLAYGNTVVLKASSSAAHAAAVVSSWTPGCRPARST